MNFAVIKTDHEPAPGQRSRRPSFERFLEHGYEVASDRMTAIKLRPEPDRDGGPARFRRAAQSA